MKAVHAVVTGLVQGVGYRFTIERSARRLGVEGWVCNRVDGSVEVFGQGAEAAVDTLIELLETGPRHARVISVEVESVNIDPELSGFETRF